MKEWLLLSTASITKQIIQSLMDEMFTLGHFLTGNILSLVSLEHKSDPIVRFLYKLSMQSFSREGNEKTRKKNATDQILENTKRQFKKSLLKR